MSDFKIFQVNKGAKFLGKVKSHKDKKAEQTKKNVNLLKLQKNIRAFLTSNTYANDTYPLLIRNTQQIIRNREYVENLWVCSEELPQLLKTRITTLTIEALMQDKFLNINIEKLLLAVTEQGQNNHNLKVRHYEFLIEKYFEIICFTNLLAKLMSIRYFKGAFENLLSHKVTRLLSLVQQIKDVNLSNQMIESYYKNSKTKIKQQKEEQSLQQLRSCFLRSMQLVFANIQNKQNEDHLLYLMSVIMQKLKSAYIELILSKYKIDRSLFFSAQFREEINQFLEEKEEWQQYQDCISPMTHLFPHFLTKFYKASLFSVEFILKIVIEISKFNQTYVTLRLQNNQFFVLLQKLDCKGLLIKQQFDLKQYELLFTVIIIQKYLQSLNDIQFVNQFRFDKQKMGKYIKTFVIKFMKDMCSLSGESDIITEILKHSELLMSNLYNKLFRTHLLSTTIFEDNSLQAFLTPNKLPLNTKFYNEMIKIVERSPFLLPINTRFMMFRNLVKQDGYHQFGYFQKLQLRVRRKHEFEDTFDQLYKKSLRSRFKVVFINEHGTVESGIDAGGLTKELLTRVFKVAFDPKFTLFIQNEKKELMPNPQYQNIKQGDKQANMYEFVGQLLGKSLYENIMLGVKFAGPFLNLLINKKNTFDDLMTVDAELYRSVVYIMGMQQGVDDLQLTFLYQDNINKKYINLVPKGHLVKVTDQNKMQYLNLLVNYKVNHSFERQTRFIRKGLRCMIKQKWLEMFNYAELNYLISGTGTIDISDWRQHTHYRGNINQDYIQTFWSIVSEFSEQQKSLLLKFVTSCERPSALGFKDIHPPFCISFVNSNHQLPTSHTCSNVLDLPIYTSRQILKQKLLYAIKAQAGFQFG